MYRSQGAWDVRGTSFYHEELCKYVLYVYVVLNCLSIRGMTNTA